MGIASDAMQITARGGAVALPVFDDLRPPPAELVGDCVHCGFCLVTCPTYLLWGQEADSPRGRIYLMKLGLEGQAPLNEKYVSHFDSCLGCMACLTACPSGVQYDKLIESTRAQIERRFERKPWDRVFRRMIFAIFPHPGRLRVLALPLLIYQRSGLQRLVRKSGILSLLPTRLAAMDDLLPVVPWNGFLTPAGDGRNTERLQPPKSFHPSRRQHGSKAHATGQPAPARLRVGMVLGCVQRVFFDEVNRATVRVLRAEGCQVITPRNQGCCGALMMHAGEEPAAMVFARRMIDAFEAANVDVIAINSAGCGSAMKEYGHLLRDDPKYADRARAFSAKCRDISEILAELSPRAARHPLAMKVAYHDACHLQHAQRITAAPRRLLGGIPKLEVLEIGEAGICCGSAGVYNLLEPDAARQLGQRKAGHVQASGADAIVSANPGCLLQIDRGLRDRKRTMAAFHWIQLLDASIRGKTLP
jgi:glycolate oxidase iron-sulfur subunit